jgi:hypothetical protein
MTDMNKIRVGGACGFWGDSMIAAPQLLQGGDLDYLVFDYLAEITLSIMAKARAKDPDLGYATDFVDLIARQFELLKAKGVKVISNAGGVNPSACARALKARADAAGCDLKIAVVLGDDLMDRAAGLGAPGEPWSANAYLGARPIAAALAMGADIVITGRCVDSAVTLGACMHEFGWAPDDFDRMAAGSLAGHILECGAQATGGLHTDWEATGDWANIGYPIAEIEADGAFTVSKPAGTGGLVSFGTVAEQLVYEIGDPKAYVLPDVVCDFSEVRIEETAPGRMRVTGARGAPPSADYKVSVTWQDGYRVGAYLTIGGEDAARKAEKVADAVLRRCGAMLQLMKLPPYTEVSVETVGAEACFGAQSRTRGAREVVLKLAARHPEPRALEMLVRELTSSGTSMAPGITGMSGLRPKVSPVVRLHSAFVSKADVACEVEMGGRRTPAPSSLAGDFRLSPYAPPPATLASETPTPDLTDTIEVPLIRLAWARSGDKGEDANIGVIARRPEYLPWVRAALTPEAVASAFAHVLEGPVERFELPGINGLNLVLRNSLGGGGAASLRNDPQGKTFAQVLLAQPVAVSRDLISDTPA